jgi:hypothetical protein
MSVMWLMVLVLAQPAQKADEIDRPGVDPFERQADPPAAAPRRADVNVPAAIEVRNEMGKRFRLVEAVFFLDGAEVARRTAGKGEDFQPAFRAYEGTLRPGAHALTVTLVYEGRNTGPFTYLDNYKYRVESTYAFSVAAADRPATLSVVAHERPGPNVPLEKKPMLDITPTATSPITPILPAR